jgi:DNA replication and repair protein RecF
MVEYKCDVARVKGSSFFTAMETNADWVALERLEKKGIDRNDEKVDLEVVMTKGEITLADDTIQKAPRKKLLVNGVPRRLVDFAGNFSVVLFAPNDMDLITESPSIRRRFLDTVLSQTDREYRRSLLSYERGLKQRNRILWKIREEGIPRTQLLFWNHLLVKNGDYISKKREELIAFINDQPQLSTNHYSIEYDKSAISEARLEQYKIEEVASATTLVGPHRDDIIINVMNPNSHMPDERELSLYGSRGEQRMGVLWLKLSELTYIQKTRNEKPTLLLDDIFSELDHSHRDIVMEVIQNNQTIMTTADPHYIEGIQNANVIELIQ